MRLAIRDSLIRDAIIAYHTSQFVKFCFANSWFFKKLHFKSAVKCEDVTFKRQDLNLYLLIRNSWKFAIRDDTRRRINHELRGYTMYLYIGWSLNYVIIETASWNTLSKSCKKVNVSTEYHVILFHSCPTLFYCLTDMVHKWKWKLQLVKCQI